MPSSDFQTYISELSNVSNEIFLKSNSKELILLAKGDFAEQTVKINESNDNIEESEIYQEGLFNIKYILLLYILEKLYSPAIIIYGHANYYQMVGFSLTIRNHANFLECTNP